MSSRESAYWFLAVVAVSLAVLLGVGGFAHIVPMWLLRFDEAMLSLPAILLGVRNIALMMALGTVLAAVLVFVPLVLFYELARVLRSLATRLSALRAE